MRRMKMARDGFGSGIVPDGQLETLPGVARVQLVPESDGLGRGALRQVGSPGTELEFAL